MAGRRPYAPRCHICFRDGNIREALAAWWLRLLFGEIGTKQARPVDSVRNDTLEFPAGSGVGQSQKRFERLDARRRRDTISFIPWDHSSVG